MNAKTNKPTGKVAQTITGVKNIAKRLTAGKTVEKKEKPDKKTAPEKTPVKTKPASKPTSKSAPAKQTSKSGKPVAKKPIRTIPAIPGKVAPGKEESKEIFAVTTEDGKVIDVTYTPGFMQHLEFRGEISQTGYHSHFGYKGELANLHEAARKKANELRAAFLKEQARQARKAKKDAPKPPQVTTRLKSQILAALVDEQKRPKPQIQINEIVKSTGAETGDVAATLMVLELSGKVKSLPGGCYRLPTAEEQTASKPTKGVDGSSASGNRGGKPRGKMSLLDAAVEVLKEAKQPLCCKDIIRAVFERKLAESGGRTPQATLSAAMGREIAAQGKGSRFRRAERGLFQLNSTGV